MDKTDSTLIPYLSDQTLGAVITELKITLSDLRFRADRRPTDLALAGEVVAVSRAHLTAVAERTARLALDKNVRRHLSQSAPVEDALDPAQDPAQHPARDGGP